MSFLIMVSVMAIHLSAAETAPAKEPPDMMRDYLRAKMVESFDHRAEALEKIKTPEDCAARQQKLREFFLRQIGGLPEKTPLNARVLGKIERDGYTIEKVLYESRPKFFVTALFYLPKGASPFPGVLFPCGHEPEAKAGESYQRACAFLASNGFAVLCYDPIGQGERAQILDAAGKQKYASTLEHTFVAVSSLPLGWGAATFRILDGIRSLDYLCSRPEVDPKRIGCTGNSGGGTMTSYLMALDERIVCAAPSCYITSLKNLILVDGPQDGEQVIPGQLAFGMDQGDYIMMRAPRPTLVCCATHDFFPIAGTWDSFRMAKRFYIKAGFGERVDIVESDAEHGYTPPLRQGMVRWMRRWLQEKYEPVQEGEYALLSIPEAQVTQSGKVLDLPGARSVWDLNREREEQLAKERQAFWSKTSKADVLAKVREITGIHPLANLPNPEVELGSPEQKTGYTLTTLSIRPEPGITLPGRLYEPEKSNGHTALYVCGVGMDADPERDTIEKRVQEGLRILTVDIRGIGATQSNWTHGKDWDAAFGPGYKADMLALLLDRPILSMRAEDILVCGRWLKDRVASAVELGATGEVGPAALHAAALEPDLFTGIRMSGALDSWHDLSASNESKGQLANVVFGALRFYDLSDLIGTLPKNKVLTQDPQTPMNEPKSAASALVSK